MACNQDRLWMTSLNIWSCSRKMWKTLDKSESQTDESDDENDDESDRGTIAHFFNIAHPSENVHV